LLSHLLIEAIDVGHGATAACGWRLGVEPVQCFVHHKDAWCARSTNKFVWAQEDSVVAIDFTRFHVNLHVWSTAQIKGTTLLELIMHGFLLRAHHFEAQLN
jgi:hypothetical protein